MSDPASSPVLPETSSSGLCEGARAVMSKAVISKSGRLRAAATATLRMPTVRPSAERRLACESLADAVDADDAPSSNSGIREVPRAALAKRAAEEAAAQATEAVEAEPTSERAPESSFEARAYGLAAPKPPCVGLPGELDRVRLIADLSRILHEPAVPGPIRAAGLLLIGWLARRMPGESAHQLGVRDTAPALPSSPSKRPRV